MACLCQQHRHANRQQRQYFPDNKSVFDAGKGKVLAYTGVPADMAKTMPAGSWLKVALDVLGGKGGGKPTNAQGQGPHIDKLPEAMSAAKAHADSIFS